MGRNLVSKIAIDGKEYTFITKTSKDGMVFRVIQEEGTNKEYVDDRLNTKLSDVIINTISSIKEDVEITDVVNTNFQHSKETIQNDEYDFTTITFPKGFTFRIKKNGIRLNENFIPNKDVFHERLKDLVKEYLTLTEYERLMLM